MSFISLMVKNPFRNRARASLAIVGIAIGIATIVALGMLTSGLESSTTTTLKAGAAEITVTPLTSTPSGGTRITVGSSNLQSASGTLNESYVTDILNISGVETTAGILSVNDNNVTSKNAMGTSNGLPVNGMDSSKLSLEGIDSINGTVYSNDSSNQLILGKTIATQLNETIGSTINVFGRNFTVTGIYESGNLFTDRGAFMSLNTLQNLTSNNGKISIIPVKVTDNANVTSVSDAIQNAYPNQITATTAADQANRTNQALGFITTASTAISLLAIVIGGIGIINVMIMSVYERTREIGVLKAVGWTRRRILTMILGESIVLTLTAAVVGIIMGVIGIEILLLIAGSGGSTFSPVLTINTLSTAVGIALLVGILGGLYPAYRASRLSPTEALRYE
jgi:putative ABC transport system permease protein